MDAQDLNNIVQAWLAKKEKDLNLQINKAFDQALKSMTAKKAISAAPMKENDAVRTSRWIREVNETREDLEQRAIPIAEEGVKKEIAARNIEQLNLAQDFKVILDTLAQIIAHWQHVAGDMVPSRFAIKVDHGLSVTLLQVFALVPEYYQKYILVEDPERYSGGYRSWLDENVMNAIIHMESELDSYEASLADAEKNDGKRGTAEGSAMIDNEKTGVDEAMKVADCEDKDKNGDDQAIVNDKTSASNFDVAADDIDPNDIKFSRKLASLVTYSLDKLFEASDPGLSYLQSLALHLDLNKEDEASWNPGQAFTFPPTTKKIVYFWNYNENHWTLIETDINPQLWTHTVYNSNDNVDPDEAQIHPSFTSFEAQKTLLERLIRAASDIPAPACEESAVIPGISEQQSNIYDCGVIAVSNAMEVLYGVVPNVANSGAAIRAMLLMTVLRWLKVKHPLPATKST